MKHTLANRRALVTGGSRGIGAAIVRRLAGEGAHVALTCSNSTGKAKEVVRAVEALGSKALALQCDSADAQALDRAVERTASELGGLDILVNNAGVIALGSVDEIKLADFDRVVAINVRALFVATQA